MDNCGCSAGSPFNNDNSLGGNNMNMNSMNMNNSLNGGMNLNMNSNGNNSNAALNNLGNSVQQLPNTNLQSNNVAASEILKAIAKNNIQQLNAEAEAEAQAQQVLANSNEQANNGVVLNSSNPINLGNSGNNAQKSQVSMGNMLLLALVVIVALAWNDAIKYYIGRMIKLNRSSPYMYLYYALIVTLLAVIAHNVVRNR